jgi:predicted PurR-regulated permease PerM
VSDPWAVAWRIVLLATAVALAIWLALTLQGVLLQMLVAVVLATGLSPLVERLHARGVPRGLAVVSIYLLFLGGLGLLGFAVVPPVVDQTEAFIAEAPTFEDRGVEALKELQARFPFLPPLDQQLAAQVRQLGGQLGALVGQAFGVARVVLGVFSGLLTAVVILLLTLYLVIDGQRIQTYFLSFFPSERHARVGGVMRAIGLRMGGWLVGQVALCLAIGIVTYVGLSLLGVKGALILAVIAAIGEVIPIVGPIVSMIPAVIVALTQSPGLALAVVVLYLVIQQLENNLLVPKIMEQAVSLHPLAVIVAILVGGELLGVVGALMAVPVAAAVAVVLDELRDDKLAPQPLSERVEADEPSGPPATSPEAA